MLAWLLLAETAGLVACLQTSSTFGFKSTITLPVGGRRRSGAARMSADVDVDVAVVGGGPAGYVMAALLGREKHSVALIDPKPEGAWPNNYGSWREEWESLAASLRMPELRDCVSTNWAKTDCFFGGSFDTPDDERTTLDRAYVKVDRKALKALLQEQHAQSGCVQLMQGFVPAAAIAPNLFDGGLVHDAKGSTLSVTSADGATSSVRARLIVDATGFESKLTVRESPAAGGRYARSSR
jgi:lycopene beta-cyclase